MGRCGMYLALQNLRFTDQERIFWVDTLCTSQKDVKEKNKQVRFMREIYEYADAVSV